MPDPQACLDALHAAESNAISILNSDLANCQTDQCKRDAYTKFQVSVSEAVQAFFQCIAGTYDIPQEM